LKKPKIVVLGAGYGGLMTVTRLQKALGQHEAKIVLVNQNDYHYETTWLHEASAGTVHHNRVRYPIASVIKKHKVDFIQDSVVKINKEEKKVILKNGEVSYDYLVIGLGYESETFGIQGLKEYTFSISNLNSARMIREHIDLQFATYHTEDEKRDGRLTIVVGGAGFTGIEFLGELTNRIPYLCKEYDIDLEKVRIYCVEANSMVLPGLDPDLVEYAVSFLKKRGVEFKLGTTIIGVTEKGIIVSKGEDEVKEIKASTIVWAAGIRGNSVMEASGFETIRGRVQVSLDMRVPGFEDIFIVGDCALLMNEDINHPYPSTAQIAMQQGELIARNLVKLIRNQTDLERFIFDYKGTLCSLGHNDAIGIVFGKKVTGKTASMMKKMIANRTLLMIGGPSLVAKKGKFNIF
jgi:NADH:ubiquinone reductase (H+-translocating)